MILERLWLALSVLIVMFLTANLKKKQIKGRGRKWNLHFRTSPCFDLAVTPESWQTISIASKQQHCVLKIAPKLERKCRGLHLFWLVHDPVIIKCSSQEHCLEQSNEEECAVTGNAEISPKWHSSWSFKQRSESHYHFRYLSYIPPQGSEDFSQNSLVNWGFSKLMGELFGSSFTRTFIMKNYCVVGGLVLTLSFFFVVRGNDSFLLTLLIGNYSKDYSAGKCLSFLSDT